MTLKSAMQKLSARTVAIMNSTDRSSFLSPATLLYGGSLLYGAGVRFRRTLYHSGVLPVRRVERPVIAIGNLVAGGTGKTPMTVHLARLLDGMGLKVMIVSRGYKSLSEKTGAVVSDGHVLRCDARSAGDEPYLMARLLEGVPVMVGRHRFETARAGIDLFSPDVVVLDDAYQHRSLARDLNLLLMDAEAPFGNGYLLPRGTLREPVSAIGRADAVILTRCRYPNDELLRRWGKIPGSRPIFCSRHMPVLRAFIPATQPIDSAGSPKTLEPAGRALKERTVFAFAGLARNEAFWQTLTEEGARVRETMGFPDHHRYTHSDIERLVDAAQRSGCRALATTDKDFVRLPETTLPLDLIVIGVDIDFGEDDERWRGFLKERLAAIREQT